MKRIYAVNFKSGFAAFDGGEFAHIITPESGGTCYPVRGDGSLCEPKKPSKAEQAELEARVSTWEPIRKLLL